MRSDPRTGLACVLFALAVACYALAYTSRKPAFRVAGTMFVIAGLFLLFAIEVAAHPRRR